jgi:hemerythrin superfamily protein
MNVMNKLSPSITSMIRLDHTHVLTTFHRYHIDTPPEIKRALVNTACLGLEIHAQLEEEIFYPEMQAIEGGLMENKVPEHDEMRRLIARLRAMEPTDAAYDDTFMQLMRTVIHHVAEEETVILPAAERLLGDRLNQLGAKMTKRRLQLAAPRTGEIVGNTVRAMPASTMLIGAGALLAGGYLLRHAFKR